MPAIAEVEPEPVEAPAHSGRVAIAAHEWLLLLILAAVQFTHIVDFMIIMPLGPVYMHEMNLSTGQFGHVMAAYTISAGIASLIASRLVDRFDRKRALLALYGGFVFGTLLCAVANTYAFLLVARIVAGAFGGVAAAVVLAIVGDVFADARRGTAMGVVMTAFSIASIAGMPAGLALVDSFGWHAPFIALVGVGTLVWILAALSLPALSGHKHHGEERTNGFWKLVSNANHLRAFALTGALYFGTSTVFPYLATFLTVNVGLSAGNLKLMYLFGGLTTVLTLPAVGRLADRFGKLRLFRVFAVATFVAVVWVTNLSAGSSAAGVLTATTVLMIVSSGRMVPVTALITNSASPSERGGFMSVNAAVQHLAFGVAADLGGALLRQESPDGPLIGFAEIGWLACGVTVVTYYLAARLRPAPGGASAPDEFIATELTTNA